MIKVLWFTNTPSLYDQGTHHYHGGGWIESLEALIKEEQSINLAISFFHPTDSDKTNRNQITYYPLLRKSSRKNPVKAVFNNWTSRIEKDDIIIDLLKVIDDFKPDVIQVFGTEGIFACIQQLTDIPVVLHLQGLINPYVNAYYPPNVSRWDFVFNKRYLLNNILGNSPFFEIKKMQKQASRESIHLKAAKYVMGRTAWDNSIAYLMNPDVHYFHIDEVLRPIFYETKKIKQDQNRVEIFSTISSTIYKGIDVILKTASLLKKETKIDYRWNLVGLNKSDKLLKYFEKRLKVNHEGLNIVCLGKKAPTELHNLLSQCDVFVHPSYIDNSPNSVCEAQMMGIPVIANFVGGIPSLISDDNNGFLLPANDPYGLAKKIIDIINNPQKGAMIGKNGRRAALVRHDRERIKSDILTTYKELYNKNAKISS